MMRKWLCLFFLLFNSVFLAGCWSNKELSQLAIISAVGIDKNEQGKYVGSYQIIVPSNVAGGLQGGGGLSNPITVFYAEADSLPELNGQLSKKISRRPFYAHTNLFVISEEFAREKGLKELFDTLDRSVSFRTTSNVVIAKQAKASDILTNLTSIDRIPSEKVVKTIELTEEMNGENINTNAHEVIASLTSPGNEPVISGFSQVGDPEQGKSLENTQGAQNKATIKADGMAVFKEGKLIDWVHGHNAQGIVWILSKIKQTRIALTWKDEESALTYQLIRQHTKTRVETKDDKPKIFIDVRAEGDIIGTTVPIDLKDPKIILEVEKTAEKEIKNMLDHSIRYAQQNKTDILKFGEAVNRSDPHMWKKLKDHWNDEVFPKVEVDVTVDVFVRRTGLRNESFLLEYEQ